MATIYDFKALSNRGKEVNVVSRRYAPVVEALRIKD